MPDVHLHLPADFSGQIAINADGGITISGADAGVVAPVAPVATAGGHQIDDDVEARLTRFERRRPNSPIRKVFNALIDQGWKPKESRADNYVLLGYEGSASSTSLYLNSAGLCSLNADDREFLAGLPGAYQNNSEVYFHFDSRCGVDQALANTAALVQVVNGQTR